MTPMKGSLRFVVVVKYQNQVTNLCILYMHFSLHLIFLLLLFVICFFIQFVHFIFSTCKCIYMCLNVLFLHFKYLRIQLQLIFTRNTLRKKKKKKHNKSRERFSSFFAYPATKAHTMSSRNVAGKKIANVAYE